MNKIYLAIPLVLLTMASWAEHPAEALVEPHRERIIGAADALWQFSELGYLETQSSDTLQRLLAEQGFSIEKSVAEIPTAFIASYGEGRPVIAILGEFDALPGISQAAVPYPSSIDGKPNGQACGHNLFGAGSMGAALAVKENAGTDGAFIWDSVARQFGLKVVELPELEASKADISVAVTSSTRRPTLALQFSRYLAAPTKGGGVFATHKYQPIAGDAWALQPTLRLDCGGVNREAVEKTINEFKQREGCEIDIVYAGCGTLVGKMQTGDQGLPDLFMTCDASYLDMVQQKMGNPFGPDMRLSSTRIIMLVAKGNPHDVESLEHLAKRDLRVGTTDPQASTLGAMSHYAIRETGLYDTIKPNIVMMADTAHTLVQTMEAGQQLDVALVYEANVQHLKGRFDFVPLQPKYAIAVQNVAANKTTPYPRLAKRLITRLASATSRRRFEQLGFQWEAERE